MLKEIILAAGIALLAVGCSSTAQLQDRAVERARNYLLKNSRDLTQAQIDFVRYNDPILLTSPIYSGAESGGMGVGLGSELNQICVAWQIPGITELVMVYGTSDKRMEHWYPERIIRKNFITHKQEFTGAANKARAYAVSNLTGHLTALQLNKVRFTAPTVYVTNFPTAVDPQLKLSETEQQNARKKQQETLQVSLVWSDSSSDVILFCGYFNPDYQNWDVNFAGRLTSEELNKHIVKKLRGPAELAKPADKAEKALFPAAESKKEER